MVRWGRLGVLLAAILGGRAAIAAPFVPGTGVKVSQVGDNFEDQSWEYYFNGAKASYEQDEEQRPPGGESANGRWYESAMRGQPDVIRRIATPPGGLPGSRGSLFLATKYSGIPGELANKQMQDDLLMSVKSRLGQPIPVSWQPSCVVRVYLPAFKRWENRTGSSFGVRGDVRGRTREGRVESYWPGMFILFRSETTKSRNYGRDFAQITVRARPNGQDIPGPVIEEPGWWTFGMSYTPEGQVHYYASPGVDDLTSEDHLYSSLPYGTRCMYFDNFMFNVANFENGQNWSTPWVIDDPAIFVIPPQGKTVQQLVRRSSGPRTAWGALFGKPAHQ
jgi:hypothetical protein